MDDKDFSLPNEQTKEAKLLWRGCGTDCFSGEHSDADARASITDFTPFLVHEIKNPLQSILAILAVMDKDDSLSPFVKGCLPDLHSEIDRLVLLLNSLLRCSDQTVDKQAYCDLNLLIGFACGMMKARAKINGISLMTDLPDDLPPLKAYEGRLLQALLNLIANAIEACGSGNKITLGARADSGRMHIFVEDDGPGISEEEAQRIFSPSYTTKPSGSGLGLVICLRAAAIHQGHLALYAPAKGGSRFELQIPID